MRCVMLSGGGGTRLWPLSHAECPKQHLLLPDGTTLFRNTLKRNEELFDNFQIVTNARYVNLLSSELEKVRVHGSIDVVLEPCPRNTAPAIAIGALLAPANEIMLVVPTDHHIVGQAEYATAVSRAEELARAGSLVVFGIEPTCPHTGYGYISYEGDEVRAFKEKPDRETAERYISKGSYLWNSGMLAFRASVMLEELHTWCPDILGACERVLEGSKTASDLVRLDEALFAQVRAESIDYAVIERSERVRVVPATFSWNDMGSLDSFGSLGHEDECGNRVVGDSVAIHGCKDVSIYNTSGKTVAVNGLDDLIVAVTDHGVYVTKRESADEIRNLEEWGNG